MNKLANRNTCNIDFLEKTHDYTNGHIAVPNGCGDFDLICPDHGEMGFIPCLSYFAIKFNCHLCGKLVKYIDLKN